MTTRTLWTEVGEGQDSIIICPKLTRVVAKHFRQELTLTNTLCAVSTKKLQGSHQLFFIVKRKISNILPVQKEEKKVKQTIDLDREVIINYIQPFTPPNLQNFLSEISFRPALPFTLKSIVIGNEKYIEQEFTEFLQHFSTIIRNSKDQFLLSLQGHEITDPIKGKIKSFLIIFLEQVDQTIISVIETFKILNEGGTDYSSTNICSLLYAKLVSIINANFKCKKLNISKENFINFITDILNQANQKFENKFQFKVLKNLIVTLKSDFLNQSFKLKQLIIKFVNDRNKKQKNSLDEPKKQQKCSKNQKQQFNPITVKWERAGFDEESYQLYCKYLKIIHRKDHCRPESYKSFLCQNALEEGEINLGKGSLKLGCWHRKYYLGDQLIAVGVVDVLPKSMSTVYFFYDPDYKKYSLGVYGVLKEIQYIQTIQQTYPDFQYYYMGFYIQDSMKMVYKSEYTNCQLLCPITLEWIPFNDTIKDKITKQLEEVKINNQAIFQLSMGSKSDDQENQNPTDLIQTNVKIAVNQKQYSICQLKSQYSSYLVKLFEQFYPLLGDKLIKNLVFSYK